MFIDADSFRTKAVREERRDQIIQAEGTPLLEKDRGTIEGMVAAFCTCWNRSERDGNGTHA